MVLDQPHEGWAIDLPLSANQVRPLRHGISTTKPSGGL